MKSFLEKLYLEEVAPQVLIEVIQDRIVSSDIVLEKLIRDSLTNVLSRKFDTAAEIEQQQKPICISRCFNQQDVRMTLVMNSS